MGSAEQGETTSSPLGRTSTHRLIAAAVTIVGLVVPMLVLLVQQFTELGSDTVPCCDYAVLDMGTRSFLRGGQLVGLYSREGWRHPGPAPFAWSAPFSLLPFDGFARFQIGVVAMHALAVSVVLIAFARRMSTSAWTAVVAFVALVVWRFDVNQFREPWNPYMAMTLLLVAVVTTASMLSTSTSRWLPVFVVSASMAAQTHMGAVPTVAILVVVLVIAMVRRKLTLDRRSLTISLIALVIAWVLPLVDLLFGDHNALRILTNSGDGPAMGGTDLAHGLVWMLSLSPAHLGRFFGTSSAFVDGGVPSVTNWLMACVAIAGGVLVIRRRSRNLFAASLAGLSLAGIMVTAVALLVSDGPFYRYLMLPITGLSVALWASVVIVVAESYAGVARTLATVVALVVGISASFDVRSGNLADSYSNEFLDSVVHQIREHCDELPEHAVVRVDASVEWFDAAPFIDQIDRCTDVRAVGTVGFVSGQSFEVDDADAVVNVRIGRVDEITETGTDIAVFDGVAVRVLDES